MDDLQPLKKANTGGLFPMDEAAVVTTEGIGEPATDNWHPQPLQKSDPNGLFQVEDSVTVVKEVVTPMQRQRRLDGTPHTVGGRTALRPEGPKLELNSLKKGLSPDPEQGGVLDTSPKMFTTLNPDEVIKAYLEKHD